MTSMPLFWVILLVVFCAVEGLTVGLVTIWFALGALTALLISLVSDSIMLQGIGFVAVSLLTMVLVRPLAARVFATRHQPTNADRIIGQEAVVTVSINPIEGTGQVKVDGKVWTARSTAGTTIPEGQRVIIRKIEGVKVLVEPQQ